MRAVIVSIFVLVCSIASGQILEKYPIFNETPKKGIYVTFKEFKFNEPSITSGFSVRYESRSEEKWIGTNAFYIKKNQGSKIKIPKKVWGFSNGVDIFVFQDVGFFKLVRNDNGFKTYAHERIDLKPKTGEIIGYSIGGLLGGAIAGAARDSRINKVLKTKFRYCLNFDGQLKLMPSETAFIDWTTFKYKETRTITLIRGKAKELPQPIVVNFDDNSYTLTPNSYEEIDILLTDKTYQICKKDNNECLTVNLGAIPF